MRRPAATLVELADPLETGPTPSPSGTAGRRPLFGPRPRKVGHGWRADAGSGALGRARMHGEPGGGPVLRPDGQKRPSGEARRPGPVRRTWRQGAALSRPLGADRAGSALALRLALDRPAARPSARAGGAPHRRPRAPRLRPRLHQPHRSGVRPRPGSLRLGRRRTLSVDQRVDAPQRTADHGPVLFALWPLAPAPVRRAELLGDPAERDRRRAPGHGGRSPGQPVGAPGADRGPRPHLFHPRRVASGELRQRAAVGELGPALRKGAAGPCALEPPGGIWPAAATRGDRGGALPA